MTTDDSVLQTVLLVLVALLAILAVMMAVAIPMMGAAGWGHMSAGTGGWSGIFGFLLPLLVLLGTGYVLYLAAGNGRERRTDEAIDELRSAYARGELSDEEFESRRSNLQRE